MRQKLLLLLTALLLLTTGNAWGETQTLYSQNFQSFAVDANFNTVPGYWQYSGASVQKIVESSGNKYLTYQTTSTGSTRNAAINFNISSFSAGDNWTVSFDASLAPGNRDGGMFLAIVGANGTATAGNAWSQSTGNLFSVTNSGASSTSYTVTVGGYSLDEALTLTSGSNYHYVLNWDGTNINLTITKDGEVTPTLSTSKAYSSSDNTTYGNPAAIYWVTTRYSGTTNIDNILVSEEVDTDLAAAKYTLGGYIKKATALNGVLDNSALATAIATAQGVLDVATTSAACNTASNNLNTAITTALSGATPVSLINGNFNTTPNNTLNGNETVFGGTLSTATSNPDNTKDMSENTGGHAYLYEVTGWTQYSTFNATAAQSTTSEYGTAMPDNGYSTNGTTPPAKDMLGETAGAALHLSAGWSDQARHQQTISNLPSGKYVLYYEIINRHSSTGIAKNYMGVNGISGDFFATTNSSVYSNLNSIEQDVWKAQAFEFDVARTADINFSVGFTTSTSGSANGAKLWIDNVLVYRIGDIVITDEIADAIIGDAEALDDVVYNATDKGALASALSAFKDVKNLDNYNALFAALTQANASKNVYAALNTAITNVEGWTATTAADGIRSKYNSGTYSNETTAANIYSEYQAAEIAALKADGAVDYTSVIMNPSFETGDLTGWSAASRTDTGVKDKDNATYSITSGYPVDGSKLFNSWGGTAENNVYQTIKNLPAGAYTLTAMVAGFNGEELILKANTTPSSVIVAGDKTVGYMVEVKFTLAEDGDVEIKASNTKNSGNTQSDYSFIKADNFHLYVATVSKTITSAGWATFCSPYALDFSSSIANLDAAYIVTGGENKVLALDEVTGTVPANTGLLLKGEGECVIPVVASSSTVVSSNKLVGVTATTVIDAETGYVLMASPEVGFYKNASAFTVGANTAYLPINFDKNNPGARSAFFGFEEDPTGISAIEATEAETEGLKDGKYLIGNKIVLVKNGVKFGANGQKLN